MIFPSIIMIRRLPCAIASFMLWVIINVVRWSRFTIISVISRTLAAVFGSRAAVCSSRSRSFGFWSVAIRRVRACLWPPERSPTLEVSLSSRPRPRIFRSSLYSSRSALVIPERRRRDFPRRFASARFSSIPIVAAVPVIGSWNTRPRYVARLCSESFVTSILSIRICPSSTGQVPATAFSIVDLPAPFPPITVTKSPSFSFRFRPFNARFSLMVPGLKVL